MNEKILKMIESCDYEIFIMGCILFLNEYGSEKATEFMSSNELIKIIANKEDTNPNGKRALVISESKNIAIILYINIAYFIRDYTLYVKTYPFLTNSLETEKIKI